MADPEKQLRRDGVAGCRELLAPMLSARRGATFVSSPSLQELATKAVLAAPWPTVGSPDALNPFFRLPPALRQRVLEAVPDAGVTEHWGLVRLLVAAGHLEHVNLGPWGSDAVNLGCLLAQHCPSLCSLSLVLRSSDDSPGPLHSELLKLRQLRTLKVDSNFAISHAYLQQMATAFANIEVLEVKVEDQQDLKEVARFQKLRELYLDQGRLKQTEQKLVGKKLVPLVQQLPQLQQLGCFALDSGFVHEYGCVLPQRPLLLMNLEVDAGFQGITWPHLLAVRKLVLNSSLKDVLPSLEQLPPQELHYLDMTDVDGVSTQRLLRTLGGHVTELYIRFMPYERRAVLDVHQLLQDAPRLVHFDFSFNEAPVVCTGQIATERLRSLEVMTFRDIQPQQEALRQLYAKFLVHSQAWQELVIGSNAMLGVALDTLKANPKCGHQVRKLYVEVFCSGDVQLAVSLATLLIFRAIRLEKISFVCLMRSFPPNVSTTLGGSYSWFDDLVAEASIEFDFKK